MKKFNLTKIAIIKKVLLSPVVVLQALVLMLLVNITMQLQVLKTITIKRINKIKIGNNPIKRMIRQKRKMKIQTIMILRKKVLL